MSVTRERETLLLLLLSLLLPCLHHVVVRRGTEREGEKRGRTVLFEEWLLLLPDDEYRKSGAPQWQ